ncbi:terminase large subunit [Curtobacterium sp. A7_M15]|uniref:terminase large subunit n=1 Tax=Curtobacterium sp. A7_M15 TaxID=3065241 RepID=UPI002737EC5E|nr:terminase large subunit [Curtobacterium sp. A7_M15]MDP4333559.1 terminase large subunit [Curtobacterium sp. A7_M15]
MVNNTNEVNESDNSESFENGVTPLARRLQDFLPGGWDEKRDSHVPPLNVSNLSDDEQKRDDLLAGLELLGISNVHPQQLMTADVINSGEETVVIEEPRRSSKSTSILAVLLGRCLRIPQYKVTFSAQSGTKTAEFMRDWLGDIDAGLGFIEESAWPFKPRRQAGSLQWAFRNGSVFKFLNTPEAKALRGGAADVVWFDEAQEFDAEKSADLKAGALPLMDTRDDAQLILSGTAGKNRSGWFWDTLETGRKGGAGVAILEYAAHPDTTYEQINDEDVWLSAHPGIGTLTTLEKMRSRREAFADPEWAMEYLGLWPEDYSVSVFDSAKWTASEREVPKALPDNAAFGFDVSRNGSTAAIVAAWREGDDIFFNLVEHRSGSSWVKARIAALSKKHNAAVGLNDIGAIASVREELERGRLIPKARLVPVAYKAIAPSCATLLREYEDGHVLHFGQAGLTESFMQVARQNMGDKAWKWVPGAAGADITPVWAATMALRAFDERPVVKRLRAVVA